MEQVENLSRKITTSKEEDDDVPLPGFRFHPTDEELVGFYLRRKIEKRPISIELIKQADIYKYDPWDLPKSSNVGDKEWYFFCKRGRKYKNSIRPNRVTGSGFWKATGIDRPIYSSVGEGHRRDCIGLKKSLVYYRGSAGKGTKTEWMMHEFRLPANHDKNTKQMDAKTIAQEAEVWTLCRILKRDISFRKSSSSVADWREVGAAKRSKIMNTVVDGASSETCSMESCDQQSSTYNISFSTGVAVMNNNQEYNEKKKPYYGHHVESINNHNQQFVIPSAASSFSSYNMCGEINELLRHADWEDLRSIVDYAAANNPFYF